MSSITSGGSSSADSCSNGHVFIYAGNNYQMPDGWPCQCRKTRWNKPSVTNDHNWPPSHEQLLRNTGNTTNDPEQKYGEREPSMTVDQMYEEWQKCLNDADYFREKYCTIKDDTMRWHTPNRMRAFEMIAPIKREGSAANQHLLNKMMGDIQDAEAKKAAVENREPMLSEDMIDMGCDPSETVNGLYPESHGKSGALWSRDYYEALIADGTLIKKDELVGWLIEHRYSDFRPYPQAVTIIIDHLNKKP